MENNNYNPSDSLMSISNESLPMGEPDSPESSCLLIFKEGEWQMLLDEDDLNYKGFKSKRASSPIIPIPGAGKILYLYFCGHI